MGYTLSRKNGTIRLFLFVSTFLLSFVGMSAVFGVWEPKFTIAAPQEHYAVKVKTFKSNWRNTATKRTDVSIVRHVHEGDGLSKEEEVDGVGDA